MQISSKRRRHSKVDGCRRRALRAARAYAAHPSCRNLSRWVQRYWFQVAGRQGRAPIEFGLVLIPFLLNEKVASIAARYNVHFIGCLPYIKVD